MGNLSLHFGVTLGFVSLACALVISIKNIIKFRRKNTNVSLWQTFQKNSEAQAPESSLGLV